MHRKILQGKHISPQLLCEVKAMKVTFLVCYAFLIQLNENKAKMRITFAKTFSIINSVCHWAFFLFFISWKRKKDHGLWNFQYFKAERKALKSESLYNKVLTHKQFMNSKGEELIWHNLFFFFTMALTCAAKEKIKIMSIFSELPFNSATIFCLFFFFS